MCVTNGAALAPPCTDCRIGVSTSRYPRDLEFLAQRPHDRTSVGEMAARPGVDREVEVTLPHFGFGIGEPVPLAG